MTTVDQIAGKFVAPKNFDGSKISFIKSLNEYSTHKDCKDSKKYALEYAKKFTNYANLLAKVDDSYFSNIGFVCKLLMDGFPDNNELKLKEKIESKFSELLEKAKSNEEPKIVVPIVKKQEYKINPDMVAFFDAEENVLNGIKYTLNFSNNKSNLEEVKKYCLSILEEMKEYKEYYLPKTIKILTPFLNDVISTIDNKLNIVKQTKIQNRKPRKINTTKLVSKLKYQKEAPEFGLKSIPPTSIIGAKKLYVFNTENRKLMVFCATNEGFLVSGTTLKNVDFEKSFSKTLRNPKEFFDKIKDNLTISVLNKAFDEINNAKALKLTSSRINEHMILLKTS